MRPFSHPFTVLVLLLLNAAGAYLIIDRYVLRPIPTLPVRADAGCSYPYVMDAVFLTGPSGEAVYAGRSCWPRALSEAEIADLQRAVLGQLERADGGPWLRDGEPVADTHFTPQVDGVQIYGAFTNTVLYSTGAGP